MKDRKKCEFGGLFCWWSNSIVELNLCSYLFLTLADSGTVHPCLFEAQTKAKAKRKNNINFGQKPNQKKLWSINLVFCYDTYSAGTWYCTRIEVQNLSHLTYEYLICEVYRIKIASDNYPTNTGDTRIWVIPSAYPICQKYQ